MTSEAATAVDPSRKSLLWLVAVGFFMQTLDATIINTALPAMAASLGESPLRMQSVVVVYALTMAILIPASGWIADRFGTRRIFFSAIVLFAAGSILCALSQGLGQLVAARVVQGMGGALLLPVGRLALLRTVPRGEFLQAMSFVAIPGLIGPLLGPTLGGWLVQYASWHWIFLINVPVGLAGLMMLPIALAGMAMKRFATPLITRHGYRRVLVVNTVLVGLTMASFGLTAPGQPMVLHVLQLLAFGAVNSLQFTAMNTITLKDLDGSMASSGNSLLSMVQMLAMSLGVAAAGAVLAGYNGIFGTETAAHTLDAFQATFASMGLITVASALIFWHLPAEVRAAQPAQPEVSGQG